MHIAARERTPAVFFEEQFADLFVAVLPRRLRPKGDKKTKAKKARAAAAAAAAAAQKAAADKLKAKAKAVVKKAKAKAKKAAKKAEVAAAKKAKADKKAAAKAKKVAAKTAKVAKKAAIKKGKAAKKTSAKKGKTAKKAKKVVKAKGAKKTTKAKGGPQAFTARVADARRAHGLLTREQSDRAAGQAARGVASHKWQFLGDGRTYQDYDKAASAEVEKAYNSWLVSPHIDVRSVTSGPQKWEYMVDFNAMEQQNVRHADHKIRKIQRVAL
jgi:hypothetical protein